MIHSEKTGHTFWIDRMGTFQSAPTFVDNKVDYANSIPVSDWEGDDLTDKMYLMNSNEAAWNGGHNATNIIMNIFICDDNYEEIDDPSVWDGHEVYKDINWGHRRADEPACYPPE